MFEEIYQEKPENHQMSRPHGKAQRTHRLPEGVECAGERAAATPGGALVLLCKPGVRGGGTIVLPAC